MEESLGFLRSNGLLGDEVERLSLDLALLYISPILIAHSAHSLLFSSPISISPSLLRNHTSHII